MTTTTTTTTTTIATTDDHAGACDYASLTISARDRCAAGPLSVAADRPAGPPARALAAKRPCPRRPTRRPRTLPPAPLYNSSHSRRDRSSVGRSRVGRPTGHAVVVVGQSAIAYENYGRGRGVPSRSRAPGEGPRHPA